MKFVSGLLLSAAGISLVHGISSPTTIVDLGYAKYQGNRTFSNTVAYLGIPYAEPPLVNQRFRAPLVLNTTRVAEATQGKTVDATNYPDFCVQGSTGSKFSFSLGLPEFIFCLKTEMLEGRVARTA